MLRIRRPPPDNTFPNDPWTLTETRLDPGLTHEMLGQAETMFALSNGYLGIRGVHDEGAPVRDPGVYLNGFHELRPITYGEHAYGFPRVGQSILNCPDGTVLRLYIDGEPFELGRAELLSFWRCLDLRVGALEREVRWVSPAGKRFTLRTTRFVSFSRKHLAAIDWQLIPEDAATVVLVSELAVRQPLPANADDPRLSDAFNGQKVLLPTGGGAEGMRTNLSFRTEASRLVLGCGMDHVVETANPYGAEPVSSEGGAALLFRIAVQPNVPVRIRKYLAYHYDETCTPGEIRTRAGWTLDLALSKGFSGLLEEQRRAAAAFWQRADVEVESAEPRRQQVTRWNLFQLLQASERAEGHGIAARGLTGRTYEGHYFWDTEIYVLPFLIYTNPRMARSVLKFRHAMLDKARARARELGHEGATFPWRTIDGREASAYYAAGTAQYHINADIAYALRKYVEVTGDLDFLHRCGAEILVETARFWRDLGFFSARREGRYCINGVTGPDEYTAVVDNNTFTNLMARENLCYAADTAEAMRRDSPDAFAELVRRTGLEEREIAAWREAAERMYVPFDERLAIHPQDDGFLDRELWDFENTPADHFPLLLHYHPLNLYRSQVIKQADTVLAMFLLEEQFTPTERKRNFDYYDPITTHDSSLSVCIQSIVANEIGYAAKALEYFRFAAAMDLSDVGGNMMHGAHIASIGGTWMALTYGFGGLRDSGGRIRLRPRLPRAWRRLRFPLTINGQRLLVDADHETTTYRLLEGRDLRFAHDGEALVLTAGSPVATRPTPPPVPEPVPEFGANREPPRPDAAVGRGSAAAGE